MRNDLIYKDLSYDIVGVLITTFKELGPGYQEKYYQKAVALELAKNKMGFKEQVTVPLMFRDAVIGRYFADFVIENKIVLEVKVGRIYPRDFKQVQGYLRALNLRLGLLATFTSRGVVVHRILNASAK